MVALKISLASAVAIAAMAPTTIPSEAAPLPTHIGTMKSMLADNVTPVRWVGGWGRGWGGGWGASAVVVSGHGVPSLPAR